MEKIEDDNNLDFEGERDSFGNEEKFLSPEDNKARN